MIPEIHALTERGWNNAEARILQMWMRGGMSLAAAEAQLHQDIDDATEEDGYDGP